ncbi:MAG: HEAT repeat domain-containing protein [Deltaproteobacteria bacterium]|nr:HEAT repeat domain-containing protein [Deltaproteobacteria bacterium]
MKNKATRLLRTAIGALCLLQNLGCGGDAERDDAVSRADSGAPGGAAIPVVRMEAPAREVERPSGRAAPMVTDVETPEPRDIERQEPDPRLTQTLDPEYSAQRLAEISKLNAAGDDLESVLDALESDPDPAVRVAAADLLAESQRREAIYGLLHALDDPSKEVVVQALQTLSLVGEADIIPWLEPLLDHPDPDISRKAEDTIYFASPGVDESDPDYGKDFSWPNESDREPDPRFDYNFGFGGDPEE